MDAPPIHSAFPEALRLPDGDILDFGPRRYIMGIVNVTPDSFSDGGLYADPEDAIAHGVALAEQGADILDIGGESTRPGAEPVSEDEELARILPVIEGLRERLPHALLSIDTTKSAVARAAVAAGAHIINDVSALERDPAIAEVAAEANAPLVLMHMRGTPKTMQQDTTYDDLIKEIFEYFEERIEAAVQAGVARSQIVLDPGIGFGKSVQANYMLIQRLRRFEKLGLALLLGTSRKSFIGKVVDKPAEARVWGTAATVACGVLTGAHIFRVHDVAEMVEVVRVAEAVAAPGLVADLD